MFAASGITAWLAPVPFKKKSSFDTVTIHKWSMILATMGMVGQMVLGVMARDSRGTLDEQSHADKHRILGYTTLGLTTLGTVVLFF